MADETGPAGITKGITRTLTSRMWTGDTNGWVETRHILTEAIAQQPGAAACCRATAHAAFTLPLDPDHYGYYVTTPSCSPMPASPKAAYDAASSDWMNWNWDETAIAAIEERYDQLMADLAAYLYDDDTDDEDLETRIPTGMGFCGCDVCYRREVFALLMPAFLEAYEQGHIRREEDAA